MALHQIIAQGFDRISDDEGKNIERKWLGAMLNQRNGGAKYSTYIGYSLLLAIGILMGMFLWNWTLRRRVTDRTARLTSTLNNLRASQEHFEVVVATTPVGVFETDMDGSWTFVNERWLEMSGLSRQQTMGDGWTHALHAETREQVLKEWAATIHQNRPFKLEFRLQHSNGHEVWVLGQASSLNDAAGKIIGHIGSMTDITDRKLAETEIEFLAYHDLLTGLPNRLLLEDRMKLGMAYADRAETKIALVFLDLDKFKTINDSLGHPIGDVMLKAVSEGLLKLVRETDTVSRLGGDEFLILLADIRDPDTITELLERALKELADTIEIEGIELSTTISMGIAIYPDDGKDFNTLLKSADTAMYCAKEAGRNTYRFFTERMNLNAVEHLRMRNSLRRALERNEFVLHYQPQINLITGRTIGVEALLRWNHPEFGMILPARFISIAEDTGLIVPIGNWVLREACRQGMAWRQAGLPEMVIAVNLSAEQFKRGDLVKSITDALDASDFDPTFLELELTESILIHDSEIVLETVQRLKSLGLKLSIDDFGTGYSSLAYLKRFNVNKLKIDQSFVRGLATDSEDAAIVHAIIQMARSLNLTTIAEGVEDENVAALLRLQHCDEAQGYYFGRPMPADAFSEYAAAASARAE